MFLPVAAFVAALVWVAYALSARRDIGAGLVPPRLGPAHAPNALRGPLGLAWRMHRGMALAWMAGAAFIGAGIGLGGQSAVETFGQSGALDFWAGRTGTGDPAEIFFKLVVYELAVYSVSMYAIMTVLRLRGAEATELFLSGPVSRARWALSHLVFAVTVPVAVLVIAGLALGLGDGDFAGGLALTTVILPGIWVMAGLNVAAFGLFRRAGAAVGWTALALSIALEVGWEVGLVSDPFFMISPFHRTDPRTGPGDAGTLTADHLNREPLAGRAGSACAWSAGCAVRSCSIIPTATPACACTSLGRPSRPAPPTAERVVDEPGGQWFILSRIVSGDQFPR